MWADDLLLLSQLRHKYTLPTPVIEAGGIERPTIAEYGLTIQAMAALRETCASEQREPTYDEVHAAQTCRYVNKPKPLGFLGEYAMEDPATGGLEIERLAEKYRPSEGTGIGTAILLSVLEHVDDPFEAIDRLRDAMTLGGIAIVSVPFIFPYHAECGQDCWRFTPTALRHLFAPPKGSELPPCWELLECDWRLDIPAEAGVLDIRTGQAQIIKSCYAVARAV